MARVRFRRIVKTGAATAIIRIGRSKLSFALSPILLSSNVYFMPYDFFPIRKCSQDVEVFFFVLI